MQKNIKKYRILGIDPGYGRLGYAVIEKVGSEEKLLTAGCIQTNTKDAYEKRLQIIGNELARILKEYSPDALAIERIFLHTNQKTVMKVAETRGVVFYLSKNLPVFEFSPPEVKLAACGYGRADKKQVEKMINLIFKIEKPLNDDAIDAIAIAFTSLRNI